MDESALLAALDVRARAWVRELRVFDAVGSTNDAVKEAARAGAPEGTVVVAEKQAAGRGRHGRSWESPAGNLFLSFLLRPRAAVRVSLVPLAAGLAVADALANLDVAPQLKWPNDVLVRDLKIAGILTEGSADAGRVDVVVVGVGVNVNVDLAAMPAELRSSATSLVAETGRSHDVPGVAAAVLGRWALWYDALTADPGCVRDAWRARSIDWWGRPVEVDSGGERLRGRAVDVDETGALVIETDSGRRTTVISGDARRLRAVP